MEIIRTIIENVKTKEPKTQILIGAGCGFAAALCSVKIAKSTAFLIGGGLLILSTLTDFTLNPDVLDMNVKTAKIAAVFQHNTFLSVGFCSGFLMGFSFA